jgi:hypothetical protein
MMKPWQWKFGQEQRHEKRVRTDRQKTRVKCLPPGLLYHRRAQGEQEAEDILSVQRMQIVYPLVKTPKRAKI